MPIGWALVDRAFCSGGLKFFVHVHTTKLRYHTFMLTDQLGSILYAPLMFPLRIRRFRKISWVNLYAIELMALTGAILRLATQVCD
jgi:hypothetical protein